MPLDDSQDPMPPETVTVSDPIVTGVRSVPDDSNSHKSSKEAYSEGGLSGEADVDSEPLMLRHRTDEEIADYGKGFEVGQKGRQVDDTKT